jgi:Velvet factor
MHGQFSYAYRENRFSLVVRQQPVAARACGMGERDRRLVDPPPIVQLFVNELDPEKSAEELRYGGNVVHCTLWDETGTKDQTTKPQLDRRTKRSLVGSLVASPFYGKDEYGKEGCFFCFPDLSTRDWGDYRLRFVLMRIMPESLGAGGQAPVVTEVMTKVFRVYPAKEFPGMEQSTRLTRALKAQGCAISVKKGHNKGSKHERDDGSEEDEGNERQSPKKGKWKKRGSGSSSGPKPGQETVSEAS